MDNQRLLIWGFFGLLGWITYQTWTQDYALRPVAAVTQEVAQPSNAEGDSDLPELTAPTGTMLDAPPQLDEGAPEIPPVAPGTAIVRVMTDVFSIEISTQGGTLQSAALINYPVAKDEPDKLVELLSVEPSNFGLLQTGLRIVGEGEEPNHLAMFRSGRDTYRLDGADELIVPMRWQSAEGIIEIGRAHV